MHLKTKISLLLFSSLLILFAIIAWNTISDLRKVAAQSAESQAFATAKVIEAGLTAHMITGTMDQRDTFMKQISSLDTMKQFWLVRSANVSHQYGKGPFGEDAHDGIDKSVLESGEAVVESRGGIFEDSVVRLSVPYKAVSHGKLDCLSCHDAKAGDTLGVISIEMQTNDLKALSYRNIIIGAIILLLLFALMVYFLHKKVIVYFDRFDAMGKCARDAESGDLSARIPEELSDDPDAKALNRLIDKFQTSIEAIQHNLSTIIRMNPAEDPLKELREGTQRLHSVHTFAQTLQRDANTEEAYEHVANYVCDTFAVNDVNIIDFNPLSQETKIPYQRNEILCDAATGCRAARTGEVVDSSLMDGICPKMITPNEHYVCVPYSITNTTTLVISAVSDKKNQLYPVRAGRHILDDMMQGIQNTLAHHQMSERIQDLQRVDPISGLFNQQYLEDRMFQIVKESKRTQIPYGVLVLNVDKFTQINDVYGIKVGDEAIRLIGRTLLDSLRESDLIVRSGGDEFVVLLYDCDPLHVANVGEKVRAIFANKKLKAHPSGFIKTVSVGTAIFPQHHKNIAECVKYARLAMMDAKREGGNVVIKFHSRLLEG